MQRSTPHTAFIGLIIALAVVFGATPAPVSAQISVTVAFGPPAIPYYVQPANPTPNDIWEPGYWAWDNGYYWVPGTWVPAPDYGLVWTPGYWGWNGYDYAWNPGYWANDIGYYGGINYGYGYYGHGYAGGRWYGHTYRYNTAITRIDRSRIRNVYVNRTVVNNHWNHVSYNGGRGGITARPNAHEIAVQRGHRVMSTPLQVRHQQYAARNRANFAHVNRGRPATAAVARPLGAAAVHRAPAARSAMHAAPHAQAHVAPHAQAHVAPHAAPQAHVVPHHAVTQSHVTPQTHAAPVHHAAPMAHAAPAYHPAPHAAAPVYHPQVHTAPAYHPAPHVHAAPAYHPAPQMHAAPAMRAAPRAVPHAPPAAHPAPPAGERREHG